MKRSPAVLAISVLMFAFAPQLSNTAGAEPVGEKYSAQLVSPAAGEVLVPGKIYTISWKSTLPNMDVSLCEMELQLSLDGGKTYTWITGERDPRVKSFDWTVPNTPTKEAVINIHFGCLGYYPETDSVQAQSTFVIASGKK